MGADVCDGISNSCNHSAQLPACGLDSTVAACLRGVGVVLRSVMIERIGVFFSAYDKDGSGQIDRHDVMSIARDKFRHDVNAAKELVTSLFHRPNTLRRSWLPIETYDLLLFRLLLFLMFIKQARHRWRWQDRHE